MSNKKPKPSTQHHSWWNPLKNSTTAANLLTIAIAASSGLIAGVQLVKSEVAKVAQEQLKPYESLMAGLSLNGGEEYELSIPKFQLYLKSKPAGNDTESTRDLAFDGMLQAIANVDDPDKYELLANDIAERMGKETPKTAWRLHTLGWYYLKTGNPDKAKDFFLKAQQKYESKNDHIASVDPIRGRLLLALTLNQPEQALKLTEAIKSNHHTAYRTNQDFINAIEELKSSGFFDRLVLRDKKQLDKTLDTYIQLLSPSTQASQN